MEMDSTMVGAGGSGRGDGSSMGFQFGKMNKFKNICFTTMGTYLTLLNCTLKNGQDGKYYVHFITIGNNIFKMIITGGN